MFINDMMRLARKIWPFIFFFLLLLTVFLTGIFVGEKVSHSTVLSPVGQISSEYLDPFDNAWNIVHDQYLRQPVNDEALMQGAIRGMMESLQDPYSAYMDPDEYRAQTTPLEGEYTGIGAWVDTSGNQLIIIGPMPDSPAEKVGIMPGDIVIGIDGEDVSSLDPNLVLKKILGPEGTSIHITIQRNGKSIEFDLERATIQVPSVESQLMENNTGYIRLYYFAVNSAVEIENAYENLQDQGATKLILDLRNNSGGYVDSAVKIASLFIDSGDILIEEWGDGTRNIYHHTGHTIDADSPMVVLVNGGSASASEIVAGALQDYGRAKLIGTTTFGKGLIQNWVPLDNNFGAVRITIAHWLTPKGRQIQDQGLAPNISVPLTEEDIQNQYDRQLNRAIEYLNSVGQ